MPESTALPPAPRQPTSGPQYGSLPPGPVLAVPSGLATASIVLACAWMAAQVLRVITAPEAARVMADAAAGGSTYLDAEFVAYDAVSLAGNPIIVAAYIVTCLWLYRSRTLAEAFQPHYHHQRGPIWAWLGWWVPVVSLWFPYQVVRDVRRATAPRPVTGIGWWWATWLVFFWFSRTADRVSVRSTPEATEMASNVLVPYEVVATVGGVVALVLWIRIVRAITAAQHERLAAPPA